MNRRQLLAAAVALPAAAAVTAAVPVAAGVASGGSFEVFDVPPFAMSPEHVDRLVQDLRESAFATGEWIFWPGDTDTRAG